MVVDDQPDVRVLVKFFLEGADGDISVTCNAANGLEALELIENCDPSVVILDEAMPVMSGLDTAEAIRVRRPDQRFVLFSAHVTPQIRERAAEIGIRICLSKMDLDLLPDAIRLAMASA